MHAVIESQCHQVKQTIQTYIIIYMRIFIYAHAHVSPAETQPMYLCIQVQDLNVVLRGVLLSICPVYVYNCSKWASIDQRLVERDLLCYCVLIPDKES